MGPSHTCQVKVWPKHASNTLAELRNSSNQTVSTSSEVLYIWENWKMAINCRTVLWILLLNGFNFTMLRWLLCGSWTNLTDLFGIPTICSSRGSCQSIHFRNSEISKNIAKSVLPWRNDFSLAIRSLKLLSLLGCNLFIIIEETTPVRQAPATLFF